MSNALTDPTSIVSAPQCLAQELADNVGDFTKLDPEAQTALVMRDYQIAYEWLDQGKLEAYAGECVAFCNGELLGHGPNGEKLRSQISTNHKVHPERLAVIHIRNEAIF